MRTDRRFIFGHALTPPRAVEEPSPPARDTALLPDVDPTTRPTLPLSEVPARPTLPFKSAPRPPVIGPPDVPAPARRPHHAPRLLAITLAVVAVYALALIVMVKRHGATARVERVVSAEAPAVAKVPTALPPEPVTAVSASPPPAPPSASAPAPVPRPVRAAAPRSVSRSSSDVRDPWGAR
jgi:hypothetical protein